MAVRISRPRQPGASVYSMVPGDRAAVVWGERIVPFVVLESASSSMIRVKITGDFRYGDVVYIHASEQITSA